MRPLKFLETEKMYILPLPAKTQIADHKTAG